MKKFQLHDELVLQKFSGNQSEFIQLPTFVSKSSLYIQGYAFKKATFMQCGFDVYFTSSYKAGLWDPALQNFKYSNKEVGAYPLMDFFINAEVKTARIFFKIEHFNQDLFFSQNTVNYMYASPYQPNAPRRYRIGFNWKFYY